jgi:hypothetical protein
MFGMLVGFDNEFANFADFRRDALSPIDEP